MCAVDLLSYASNQHSQGGEDGMLDKLFELMQVNRGYFVEFGAWDGMT